MPFPAGAAPPKELKATQPLLPITIRSSATSSAPPVATLRSLRTNGEEEEVEVFEEAAAEIDGDGDAGELDAVLLLGGGRGGGISAAAEALLAAESRGGSPRSESTSRTWTASPSPSESVMFAFFFLREWKKLCSFPPCSSFSLPSLLSSPLFSKENETVEKSQRQTESNSARLLDPLFPGTARTASASLSLYRSIEERNSRASKTRFLPTSTFAMASPTALSAGAVQHAARVARLYRHALKNIQSWAVDRELFWEEVN